MITSTTRMATSTMLSSKGVWFAGWLGALVGVAVVVVCGVAVVGLIVG